MRKIPKIALLTSAVILTLSACSVTTNSVKPQNEKMMMPEWRTEVATQASLMSAEAFWRAWNDDRLLSLIEKAQKDSPSIEKAKAKVIKAEADTLRTQSVFFPSASIDAAQTRERGQGDTQTNASAALSGSWRFNLAGAQYWDALASDYQKSASLFLLKEAQNLVAAQVAQTYMQLGLVNEKLRLSDISINSYEKLYEVANWKWQSGLSHASDREDALSRLSQEKAEKWRLNHLKIQYQNTLSALTGMPITSKEISDIVLPTAMPKKEILLPAEIVRVRADVRACEEMLSSYLALVKASRAEFLPTFALTGSLSTRALSFGDLGDAGSGLRLLTGSVTLPIFNWGALISMKESRLADVKIEVANYRETVMNAIKEVDDAIAGSVAAQERSTLLEQAQSAAKNAYDIERLSYESGVSDYEAVQAKLQNKLNTDSALLENRHDYIQQRIALYRSLGGAEVNYSKEVNHD